MTDDELLDRLRDYLWLAANTPNAHAGRIDQLQTGGRENQSVIAGWGYAAWQKDAGNDDVVDASWTSDPFLLSGL